MARRAHAQPKRRYPKPRAKLARPSPTPATAMRMVRLMLRVEHALPPIRRADANPGIIVVRSRACTERGGLPALCECVDVLHGELAPVVVDMEHYCFPRVAEDGVVQPEVELIEEAGVEVVSPTRFRVQKTTLFEKCIQSGAREWGVRNTCSVMGVEIGGVLF